jgi:hypothetical protein
MQRINQGFFHDACIVAAYNLKLTSQLEYFHQQQYQKIVINVYQKALTEE